MQKLAEYNFNKFHIENLKSLLSRKKNEFLSNISKKLYGNFQSNEIENNNEGCSYIN